MQERVVLAAAPVAPVDRLVGEQVERAGHRPAVAERHNQQDAVGKARADLLEELPVEVRTAPLARGGIEVEIVERVPVRGRDVVAGKAAHLDVLHRLLALLADVLALARGERGEEPVEIVVAGIVPVELATLALEEAHGTGELPFGAGREVEVERGHLHAARNLDHAGEKRLGEMIVRARRGEQARPRRRGERHRGQQLRVVAPARVLECIGPGPVEHVFAVGMALHVHGRGGDQPPVAPGHREVAWQPAGFGAHTARRLERVEEVEAGKRVEGGVGGAQGRVPLIARHVADA